MFWREINAFPAEQILEKNMSVHERQALTDITCECMLKKELRYFVNELLVRDSEVSTCTLFDQFSFPTV
jgi:hypothetical protein